MSKEEAGCKLTSVYKHKERKPKKPHYIPRPWGKPYNYKCFQCPFTCMEKSHLYNHMKYSLCKNSLSLLIESDWPYKKGNLLHPELRLLHASEAARARDKHANEPETCDAASGGTTSPKHVMDQDHHRDKVAGTEDFSSERMSKDINQFQGEEEEEEEVSGLVQNLEAGEKEKAKEVKSGGHATETDVNNTLLFRFKNKRDKPSMDPAPDFIITDVFSLKNHVMKGKELELDVKPKHCKVPKKCPVSSGILMEQWKLVANGQRRSASEIPTPCSGGNIIPCYPPPTYGEYHEPQSLNLSLLGINYPLSSNLFSYLSPSISNSTTSQSPLAQLPFLASTAQLLHPHSAHFQPLQNSEGSAFVPRFYYPLLFEHSFSSAESKMAAVKPEIQQQLESTLPSPSQAKSPTEPHKASLLKIPMLKTSLPWMKGFHDDPSLEQNPRALLPQDEEEKWLFHEKESNSLLGVHSTHRKMAPNTYRNMVGIKEDTTLLPTGIPKAGATGLESSGISVNNPKKKCSGGGLDLVGSDIVMPGKVTYQASGNLRSTPTQLPKSLDHWHVALHACPPEDQDKSICSDVLSPGMTASHHLLCKPSQTQDVISTDARDAEATTVLMEDLSKILEEYQKVEKKLSDLAKEDTPAQKDLREQLIKIRRELCHIHQALEKASKPSEGPLDLSVKKSTTGLERGVQVKKDQQADLSSEKRHGKDLGSIKRGLAMDETSKEEETSNGLFEAENKTIDLLIKMSRSENLRTSSSETHLGAVIKAEVLPLNVPLDFRQVIEPYYSHTTKCEADSSVLLCTDGRSNVSQGPPLSVTEDIPLGCRPVACSLSCSLPNETEGVCIHSPLNTDM